MKHEKRTFLLLLGLLLAAAPAVAQENVDREYGDQVLFLDEEGQLQKADKVKILEATYEKVVYELRGGRTKAEKTGAEVVSVTYGDAPRVYNEGLQNVSREQYRKAVSDFDGAKNAVPDHARAWLLEYASVKKGGALEALGKFEDAVRSYREALEANPKTLIFDEVQLGLARCHSELKKWSEAEAAAQTLLQVGRDVKRPVWQASASRALAQLLVAQGRHPEAVNAYENLVALAQRELRFAKSDKLKRQLADIETDAAVEEGWAKIAWAESSGNRGEWSSARSYFEGLVGKYSDSDKVAAAALNGVGRCLLDEDPRGALLKFVEAEVTHFAARREVARALHLKAKALRALGNNKMAQEAERELKEFYPTSPWARE